MSVIGTMTPESGPQQQLARTRRARKHRLMTARHRQSPAVHGEETNVAVDNESERLILSQRCRAAIECIEKSKVRIESRATPASSHHQAETQSRISSRDHPGAAKKSSELHYKQCPLARLSPKERFRLRPNLCPYSLAHFCTLSLVLMLVQISNQQMLYFNSPSAQRQNSATPSRSSSKRGHAFEPMSAEGSTNTDSSSTALSHWRSHQILTATNNNDRSRDRREPTSDSSPLHGQPNEARGALSRNLYSRGPRNASLSAPNGGGGGGGGSWHFPRISPEQAAEVLITGAQVINKIAQAESPLNYCRTPDNQEGECSDIRKCIWLVLDKARLKQSVCLRNLFIPAVCCPISNANNTPIANMIQSTLEPVLFRPKGQKQKGPPARPTSGGEPNSGQPSEAASSSSVMSPQQVSSSSLVVKNPTQPPSSTSTTTSTTTSTSSTAMSTTSQRPTSGSTAAIVGSSDLSPVNPPHDPPAIASTVVHSSVSKPTSQYVREKSSKYSWANDTCGESSRTRTGRIVGGSDSKLGQWPWMTAMYLNKRNAFNSGAGEFWCGGALINRRFILTAAHCLSDQRGNRYKNDQVTIKLGGVDLVRHQAPTDILRNADLGPESAQRSSSSSQQPQQFFTTHLTPPTSKQNRRSASSSSSSSAGSSWRHRTPSNGQSSVLRSSEEDEEFSWASFITKALGLVGVGSGSSSSPASVTVGPSPSSSSDGSTKSVDGNSKRQQLAAHARKIYFKEYKVANIKQHPKFQRHGFYNDIGLIELKSDVDFDELVSPICLPTEHDLKRDLTGYVATVLGWGTLSYGGQGSKLLQQVSMPVWSNKDCDERYLQHIGNTFLCAGFLTGGKDACQGDSGGPLMVSDQTGRWTLHGVVSFGKQCGLPSYPGVFSRVTQYLDWIEENTRGINQTNPN